MSLAKETKITITGRSVIDGVEACGFQAQINSENPDNMSLNTWQTNTNLYKENREQCRADRLEFEEYCFEVQDGMIKTEE